MTSKAQALIFADSRPESDEPDKLLEWAISAEDFILDQHSQAKDLVRLLKSLDEAYCRAGEQTTPRQRMADLHLLISVRDAVAAMEKIL